MGSDHGTNTCSADGTLSSLLFQCGAKLCLRLECQPVGLLSPVQLTMIYWQVAGQTGFSVP